MRFLKLIGIAVGVLVALVAALIGYAFFSRPGGPAYVPYAPSSAPVVSVTEVPAPATLPPSKTVVVSRAVATFRKSGLDECSELVATASADHKKEAEAFLDGRIRSSSKPERGRETTELQTPCAEQFADRTALASCRIVAFEKKTDAGSRSLVVTSWYYNATELSDDHYMKDCLSVHGEWKAASKDDPEAARARLRQRANQILREVGQ